MRCGRLMLQLSLHANKVAISELFSELYPYNTNCSFNNDCMSWLKIQLSKRCSAFNHRNLLEQQGVQLLYHSFLSRWRPDGLMRRYFAWTRVLRLFCSRRRGRFKEFPAGLLPITGDHSEICLTNYAFSNGIAQLSRSAHNQGCT